MPQFFSVSINTDDMLLLTWQLQDRSVLTARFAQLVNHDLHNTKLATSVGHCHVGVPMVLLRWILSVKRRSMP